MGFLISAVAPNIEVLLLGLFVLGIGRVGSMCWYGYLMEFIPAQNRGEIMSKVTIFAYFGVFYFIGAAWLLSEKYGWRWLCVAAAGPGLLSLLAAIVWGLPESPRWLLSQNKHTAALSTLRRIAHTNNTLNPHSDQQLEESVMAVRMAHNMRTNMQSNRDRSYSNISFSSKKHI